MRSGVHAFLKQRPIILPKVAIISWKMPLRKLGADYEQMKQEAINTAVDWAWAKDPNPMDIEWARTFWLPKVIDGMDINTNDKLVEELLYKI